MVMIGSFCTLVWGDPIGLASALPHAGRVQTITQDVGTGVWTIELSNGVLAHHYPVGDEVVLVLWLSGGVFDQPLAPSGELILASAGAWRTPGTGATPPQRFSTMLQEREIRVDAGSETRGAWLRVSGPVASDELVFEVVYALLSDATIDQQRLDVWREAWQKRSARRDGSEQRILRELVSKELGTPMVAPGGDIPIEGVSRVLHQLGTTCSIEVGIAGNIERARVLDLSARYLGALPDRAQVRPQSDPGTLRSIDLDVRRDVDKAGVFVGVQCGTGTAIDQTRALRLGASVLEDRLTLRLVEGEVGARYEPGASAEGVGLFYVVAIGCGPQSEQIVREEIERLAREGIAGHELDEARGAWTRRVAALLDRPGYWARVLSRQRGLGFEIGQIARAPKAYAQFDGDEIRRVLGEYLSAKRWVRVGIHPDAAGK